MATARTIKKRIRSTKNIKQITKAMQAVAAVKMRRSEEVALRARPFAAAALHILTSVTHGGGEDSEHSPLLRKREVKKACLVIITSDKGLAGSFNTNVLRAGDSFLMSSKVPTDIVAVGKKALEYYRRRGRKIAGDFQHIGDSVDVSETKPISLLLSELFTSGVYDSITLIYTNFDSALKQTVIRRPLLPFTRESLEGIVAGISPSSGKYSKQEPTENTLSVSYLFEPSPKQVLNELLPILLDIEIYHAVLEANASEHSSRMVAMKNASENAGDLIDTLTVAYNKSRQAQITRELSEITAGTEALTAV